MGKFRFTKAAIEALTRPETGWRFHYDTEAKGLAIAIGPKPRLDGDGPVDSKAAKTGNLTFYLYRRILGRPEKLKLGSYADLTIDRARTMAAQHNGQIAEGKNPAEIARALRAELTLGALFRRYIAEHAIPRGKKTVASMEENFARYLGDIGIPAKKPRGRLRQKPKGAVNWEDRRLSQISDNDVRKLHTSLGASVGHYTANRTIQLLRSVFNFGIQVGELPATGNPAARIGLFDEEQRERFLLPDELPRFFEALAAEPNDTIRCYVLASILTGARRANVLAMRWEHLNLDRGEWRIPGGEMKNGKAQTVVLVPELVEALTRQRERVEAAGRDAAAAPSHYAFPSSSQSGHLESPKSAWARLLRHAGLSDLRIHDLRRSLGSWQAREGASLSIIGKSLNHRSIQSTAIYARLDLDPVRQSVERATTAMLVAGGVKKGAEVTKLPRRKQRGHR